MRVESSADEYRVLLELSREVTSTLDLQEVLDRSLAALRRLLSFGGGAIQLIDGDALVAAATDPPASPEALTVRIPVGHGVSGTIAATGEPVYIPDITVDPRVYPQGRAKGVSTGVRSYFGVPLILHGKPTGVVQIDAPEVDAFPLEVRRYVLAFVPTIAAAVQNAQLFEREREALARLREAERLKSNFVSVASHELRTPLTTIAGFAEILEHRAERLDAAMVADFGRRIAQGGRRLGRLVEDMLFISDIERGVLRIGVDPTDVEPVVQEAVAEAGEATGPIEVETDPDLPLALANSGRLQHVVAHLLGNAAKFSEAGMPITVRVRATDESVLISVEDRGRGIPPEMLDRVFERFFQVSPAETRETGGLGVGLYLVKQLCDRMGGRISATSELGRGSIFTVELLRADLTGQDTGEAAGQAP
ncbi:MAG: ATP-binding protein [Actinomycetota bacterium]